MWLTIDMGNSAIKGAAFVGERLEDAWRLALSEPWEPQLSAILRRSRPERVGFASVAPQLTDRVKALVARETGAPIQEVHHRMRLPFDLAYRTPESLGPDRLAAAAAAWRNHGGAKATVAIDAGTAVTFEVVDRDGVYRGGVIGAAPVVINKALCEGASMLPSAPLSLPPSPIGESTQEALQSGIMYGFLDHVAGSMARIEQILGEEPFVVVTGGWSRFLKAQVAGIHFCDEHLVLRGIQLLMALNPLPHPS